MAILEVNATSTLPGVGGYLGQRLSEQARLSPLPQLPYCRRSAVDEWLPSFADLVSESERVPNIVDPPETCQLIGSGHDQVTNRNGPP